jgi:cell wall-associated NlpC family hydrolase
VGFDCSGLALYAVYQAAGIVLPQGAGMQSAPGGKLISNQADLQPGDLVFFGGGSLANFEHVGIYAGGEMMWDASNYNIPVQEHSLAWEEAALAVDGGVRCWTSAAGTAHLQTAGVGSASGRTRVFAIGTNDGGNMYVSTQTAAGSSSWSGWQNLGGKWPA